MLISKPSAGFAAAMTARISPAVAIEAHSFELEAESFLNSNLCNWSSNAGSKTAITSAVTLASANAQITAGDNA